MLYLQQSSWQLLEEIATIMAWWCLRPGIQSIFLIKREKVIVNGEGRHISHALHQILSSFNLAWWLKTTDQVLLLLELAICALSYVCVLMDHYCWQACCTSQSRCLMQQSVPSSAVLTHWDRVIHICISKLTIIGSDNGLSPGWCQAIIWTNAGILLIGPLGISFSEILIAIHTFSFKKMHLKMSSAQ